MWASMSWSTSLSSSIFGLAKTANPTLRNASTQGRTTSALPGAMLVKTVASGSMTTPGRAGLASAVRASSQRPRASNRGRSMAVGRRPRMEPRPMSRLGASQTSSTRPAGGWKLLRPSADRTAGDSSGSGVASDAAFASSVRLILIAYSSSKPDEFVHGTARFFGLGLVLGGGAHDRDRQPAPRVDSTQPGFSIAGFGDVLGVARMVRRGVQDTTRE